MTVKWFDPGKKVYWRGRWWDNAMCIALKDCERADGADYFYQGSFNHGVGASAGTHNGGAVGDARSRGLHRRKVRARRGIVSWPRTRAQGFMVHDHFMLQGGKTASPQLKAQMYSWDHKRNGLAGNGPDDSGVRGDFRTYNAWRASLKHVGPVCSITGVNKSKKYGNKVRSYYSVKLVQKALNKLYKGKTLKVDGIYGKATSVLFDKFRKANFKSGTTGTVGATSLKLLFKKAGMAVSVQS